MIREINLKDDLNKVVYLIYQTFCLCNKFDSSKKLIDKMDQLFWPWIDINYTKSIFEQSSIVLVYELNWEIIWIIRSKRNRIANLFVNPSQQGKWIGKQLLNKLEIEAKRLWYKEIYLKPSKYALSFYQNNWYITKDDKYLYKKI